MAMTEMSSLINTGAKDAQFAKDNGLERGASPLSFLQQYQTPLLIAAGALLVIKLLF